METSSKVASMVCGVICLAGCSQEGTLPGSVTGAFEQAFSRDDLAACVELFTDDAQILVEHGPVIAGREDIQHFLSEQITPIISFNTEADMTTVRSDLGIEQGHYRVRDVRRGSDVEEGKYIHVWRKQGGDWKLWRVIWNADVSPDTEVSVSQAPEGAM